MKLFLDFVIYLQRFADVCDDTVSPTDTRSHPTANRCNIPVTDTPFEDPVRSFLTKNSLHT